MVKVINYVWNGTEVKLTGRTAVRELSTKSSRRHQPKAQLPDVLHEITPINQVDGEWKKWVKKTELFVIEE